MDSFEAVGSLNQKAKSARGMVKNCDRWIGEARDGADHGSVEYYESEKARWIRRARWSELAALRIELTFEHSSTYRYFLQGKVAALKAQAPKPATVTQETLDNAVIDAVQTLESLSATEIVVLEHIATGIRPVGMPHASQRVTALNILTNRYLIERRTYGVDLTEFGKHVWAQLIRSRGELIADAPVKDETSTPLAEILVDSQNRIEINRVTSPVVDPIQAEREKIADWLLNMYGMTAEMANVIRTGGYTR